MRCTNNKGKGISFLSSLQLFENKRVCAWFLPKYVLAGKQGRAPEELFQTSEAGSLYCLQDEYQFCYQAALEYLGSFDHYAT